MRRFYYLSVIILFAILTSCSDTPTEIINESISKRPVDPPPPAPLFPALVPGTNYIAGNSGGTLYIWKNNTRIWSGDAGADVNGLGIGNFTGDSDKELVAVRRIALGRGKDKIEKQQLLVFIKNESSPAIVELRQFNSYADAVWDLKVRDIDKDGIPEIAIVFRDQLEIWKYNGSAFLLIASANYFSSSESPWSADFGNLDTDNADEIIVSFTGNKWRAYKFNGTSISLYIESSVFSGSGNLDCAKVSDVDNDGSNEVIGGSFPYNVLLWETPFTGAIVSKTFTGMPWAVGAAGQEIFLGGYEMDGLFVLNYNGTTFSETSEQVASGFNLSLDGIVIEDMNNDGYPEIICATTAGLRLFNRSYVSLFTDNVGEISHIECQ